MEENLLFTDIDPEDLFFLKVKTRDEFYGYIIIISERYSLIHSANLNMIDAMLAIKQLN